MSGNAGLLDVAVRVLEGTAPDRARMSCWLTRSALEAVVTDALAALAIDAGEASMRSRLVCLEVAYADRPELAARAEYAWCRLSQACHQHAYQLSPTYSEALHLHGLVRSFADSIAPRSPARSAG